MATLTKTKVKNALEKAGGMPVQASRLLKVDYSTLYRFMKKHPELEEIRESARSKLHEDLESLTTFAVKTGFIQKSALDENGKPTSETIYEEVDVRTRLQHANLLMNQYKGSVGIKEEIDVTTKGEKVNSQSITVIELPEALRPKPTTQEASEPRE